MIASMWNLGERLAELRPSESELRLARERRDAAANAGQARATARHGARHALRAFRLGGRAPRAIAG